MKVVEENAFDSECKKDTTRFFQSLQDNLMKSQPCCGGWLAGVAEVTPELYLCAAPAVNPAMLRALQVTCVVNAAPELPPTPAPECVACVRVAVRDSAGADIAQHIDAVADTIEQVRERGGRTLVHCVAGVSRSAALCLGYLVKHEGMSLRDAWLHLRARRPAVKPNCGFFRQLIEYELRVRGHATVEMVYSRVTRSEIPDLYETDYRNMMVCRARCDDRFGRN